MVCIILIRTVMSYPSALGQRCHVSAICAPPWIVTSWVLPRRGWARKAAAHLLQREPPAFAHRQFHLASPWRRGVCKAAGPSLSGRAPCLCATSTNAVSSGVSLKSRTRMKRPVPSPLGRAWKSLHCLLCKDSHLP